MTAKSDLIRAGKGDHYMKQVWPACLIIYAEDCSIN